LGKELTELQFTEELINALSPCLTDAKIDSGISVLYEMPIDDNGIIRIGVDRDTGQAYRGKGTGFEQDVLVYEEKSEGNTTIIPRVIAEVKYGRVTTHDAIVYSYKAECIKRIYPFCRYGMILGGMKTIPGRVLRHGRAFDFILTLAYPFLPDQVSEIGVMFLSELETSRLTGAVMKGTKKLRLFRRGIEARDGKTLRKNPPGSDTVIKVKPQTLPHAS
jgi:hypothetical protein